MLNSPYCPYIVLLIFDSTTFLRKFWEIVLLVFWRICSEISGPFVLETGFSDFMQAVQKKDLLFFSSFIMWVYHRSYIWNCSYHLSCLSF